MPPPAHLLPIHPLHYMLVNVEGLHLRRHVFPRDKHMNKDTRAHESTSKSIHDYRLNAGCRTDCALEHEPVLQVLAQMHFSHCGLVFKFRQKNPLPQRNVPIPTLSLEPWQHKRRVPTPWKPKTAVLLNSPQICLGFHQTTLNSTLRSMHINT